MTNAQTEARAIARKLQDVIEGHSWRLNIDKATDIIATALAAKDAELDRLEIAKREAVAGWREAETRATANHSLAVANGTRAREEHDRAERALGRKA